MNARIWLSLLVLALVLSVTGAVDAARPGPSTVGWSSPAGIKFVPSTNTQPVTYAIRWHLTNGPVAYFGGAWQLLVGALHASTHKVGGTDSIGAASTSTNGLSIYGTSSTTTALYAVQCNDTRLTNARTPTAHQSTHRIGGSDALPAASQSVPGLASLSAHDGTTAGKVVQADDPRLALATTARLGTVSLATDGGTTAGTVPEATDSRLAAASTSNRGTVSLATDGGTTAGTAVQGNDSRLAASSTTNRGTVSLATSGGTTVGTVVEANDSRLSNSRDPNAHQGDHRIGGADALPAASTTTNGLASLAEDGGTTAATAVQGSDSRLAAASTSNRGTVSLAEDRGTTAGTVVNANDSRLTNATGSQAGLMPSTHWAVVDALVPASYPLIGSTNTGSIGFSARVTAANFDGDGSGLTNLPSATTATAGVSQLAPDYGVTNGHAVNAADPRMVTLNNMRWGLGTWGSGLTTATIDLVTPMGSTDYIIVPGFVSDDATAVPTGSSIAARRTTSFDIHAVVAPTGNVGVHYIILP